MNINYISRNVGIALVFNAAFMFLGVLVSLCYGMDASFSPLLLSGVITLAVGCFPLVFVKKIGTITVKEGFFTIVLTWLLVCVFGALPYILWGGDFAIIDAWFESGEAEMPGSPRMHSLSDGFAFVGFRTRRDD